MVKIANLGGGSDPYLSDYDLKVWQPAAHWTPDCSNKWDYDGSLIDFACRTYPDGMGVALIVLRSGPTQGFTINGDPRQIIERPIGQENGARLYEQWFQCGTQDEVKREIEQWCLSKGGKIIQHLQASINQIVGETTDE